MGVQFYCGITGEKQWNKSPMQPGAYACVSPVHGRSVKSRRDPSPVAVPEGTQVLLDSGAFNDSHYQRVTQEQALERQLRHAEHFGYAEQIEALCSYDWLVDEQWQNDERHKLRMSELQAEHPVNVTIRAATFLSQHRHLFNATPVLNCQGVTPQQYLRCAGHVIDWMDKRDWLGLGGWCVLGIYQKVEALQECFRQTINRVIPYAAKRGVKRVHIFGVIFPRALGKLLHICDEHGIALSTDSTSPSLYPTNKQWGFGDAREGGWRDNQHTFAPLELRGLERAEHVRLTREWLARLNETQFYVSPKDKKISITIVKPKQIAMAI